MNTYVNLANNSHSLTTHTHWHSLTACYRLEPVAIYLVAAIPNPKEIQNWQRNFLCVCVCVCFVVCVCVCVFVFVGVLIDKISVNTDGSVERLHYSNL